MIANLYGITSVEHLYSKCVGVCACWICALLLAESSLKIKYRTAADVWLVNSALFQKGAEIREQAQAQGGLAQWPLVTGVIRCLKKESGL